MPGSLARCPSFAVANPFAASAAAPAAPRAPLAAGSTGVDGAAEGAGAPVAGAVPVAGVAQRLRVREAVRFMHSEAWQKVQMDAHWNASGHFGLSLVTELETAFHRVCHVFRNEFDRPQSLLASLAILRPMLVATMCGFKDSVVELVFGLHKPQLGAWHAGFAVPDSYSNWAYETYLSSCSSSYAGVVERAFVTLYVEGKTVNETSFDARMAALPARIKVVSDQFDAFKKQMRRASRSSTDRVDEMCARVTQLEQWKRRLDGQADGGRSVRPRPGNDDGHPEPAHEPPPREGIQAHLEGDASMDVDAGAADAVALHAPADPEPALEPPPEAVPSPSTPPPHEGSEAFVLQMTPPTSPREAGRLRMTPPTSPREADRTGIALPLYEADRTGIALPLYEDATGRLVHVLRVARQAGAGGRAHQVVPVPLPVPEPWRR